MELKLMGNQEESEGEEEGGSLLRFNIILNNKFIMPLSCIIVIFCLITNCNEKNKEVDNSWHEDKEPILKRLPFIKDVESCLWKGGVSVDRSEGMVPAPSSYYIKGYVKLTTEDNKKLRRKYKWKIVNSSDYTLEKPDVEKSFVPLSGDLMLSNELISTLVSMTTYRNGVVLLSKENSVLYFDLSQD